jgi:hypothetical protein
MSLNLTDRIKRAMDLSPRVQKGLTLFNGVVGTTGGLSGIGYSVYKAAKGEYADAMVTALFSLYILSRGVSNSLDYVKLKRKD